MKRLKILLAWALLVFVACTPHPEENVIACLPNNLANGVIAYYPFANGSLADASIYSNNLSNTTGAHPTADRNGNTGCAYQFENETATAEFLVHYNPMFLNGLNSFSVSLWYKHMVSNREDWDYEGLVSRGPFELRCPDRRGEWTLGLYDGRMAVFGHNNSVWAEQVPTSVWGDSTNGYTESPVWHHLVCIKNNDTYQLYFDAVLQTTKTGSANCGPLAQDAGALFIGKEYTGKLDDIVIYNRGLSQQEVTALYNLAPCCE